MSGYIDLHCHPLPGIDDGVRTAIDGARLLSALADIGFTRVVATPHVRPGLWDNTGDTVAPARALLDTELDALRSEGARVPSLDVAAENLFDDVVSERFDRGEALLYPGGRAALIEFPYESLPLRVEVRLWRLCRRGILPVIAHPERYAPIQREPDRWAQIHGAGARGLLDVMSLTGAYGRAAQRTAEALLSRGAYSAACTDAHKPSDVPRVAEAMELLQRTMGDDGLRRLFIVGPDRLLDGRDA